MEENIDNEREEQIVPPENKETTSKTANSPQEAELPTTPKTEERRSERKRERENEKDEMPKVVKEHDETIAPPMFKYQPEQARSCCGTRAVRGGKLHAYDWLEDLPTPPGASDLVEVQFKNTRKGYYRNSTGLQLKKGDIVAVESSPGHDIGEVTLQGRLVYLQMHKNHINPATYEYKRVYRIARQTDIEKWEEAKALEHSTMLESRRIAQELHLNMKIGDVEYQGDRTKAIFYYIADERVDFRELIKVLADHFKVRIEMRQIGARQEAGRIGGIGPCGRDLCCTSWMTSFVSVSTHSARIQDLSLNPTKLAGQCGKLKCCLNFELATYLDAIRSFPPTDKPLETEEGTYFFFKYDIFKRLMWYSPQKDSPVNIVALEPDHVREIQQMNAQGQKPANIGATVQTEAVTEEHGYSNVAELEDDLTRFDKTDKGRHGRRGQDRGGRGQDRRRGQRQPQNGQNNANQGGPQQRQHQNHAQRNAQNTQGEQGTLPTADSNQQNEQGHNAQRNGGRPFRDRLNRMNRQKGGNSDGNQQRETRQPQQDGEQQQDRQRKQRHRGQQRHEGGQRDHQDQKPQNGNRPDNGAPDQNRE